MIHLKLDSVEKKLLTLYDKFEIKSLSLSCILITIMVYVIRIWLLLSGFLSPVWLTCIAWGDKLFEGVGTFCTSHRDYYGLYTLSSVSTNCYGRSVLCDFWVVILMEFFFQLSVPRLEGLNYDINLTTDIRGDPYTAIVNPLATNPRCNTAVSWSPV